MPCARYALAATEGAGPIDVIVVDNASTDATAAVARQFDSPAMPVRVVRCDRRGKGAAVRAGVAATTAERIGFMDADGATDLARPGRRGAAPRQRRRPGDRVTGRPGLRHARAAQPGPRARCVAPTGR